MRPMFQNIRYYVSWAKEQSDTSKYVFPSETSKTPQVITGSSAFQPVFTVYHNDLIIPEDMEVLLFTLYQDVPLLPSLACSDSQLTSSTPTTAI